MNIPFLGFLFKKDKKVYPEDLFLTRAYKEGLIFCLDDYSTLNRNIDFFSIVLKAENGGYILIATTSKKPAIIAELVQTAQETKSEYYNQLLKTCFKRKDKSNHTRTYKISFLSTKEEINESISIRDWLKEHGFYFEEKE